MGKKRNYACRVVAFRVDVILEIQIVSRRTLKEVGDEDDKILHLNS